MDRSSLQVWTRAHPDAADTGFGLVAGLVVALATYLQRGPGSEAVFLAGSLGLAIGAILVLARRRSRERATRQATAELVQRLEIARELHDSVAHHVSVIGIQAAAARRNLDQAPDVTRDALEAIEMSSRAAVNEMQRLVTTLRRTDPPAGASVTEATAPDPTLPDLHDLLDRMRSAGLRIELDDPGGLTSPGQDPGTHRVGRPAQTALYRVAQEALTNARRHAGPVAVTVALALTGRDVTMWIESGPPVASDPGANPTPSGGMGIPGMRERIAAVGGRLDLQRTPDGSTVVVAAAPLDPS